MNVMIRMYLQGAKKIIFTACHSGKLKLTLTSPDVISTSSESFLTSRIDFTVLLLFKFLKKHHLPVGKVKNRIHQPDRKIHQPWAIGHYFLCTLYLGGIIQQTLVPCLAYIGAILGLCLGGIDYLQSPIILINTNLRRI